MSVHAAFSAFRRIAPMWAHGATRNVATALLTPIRFATRTGHFRSSLAARALDRRGDPIPWYTYPCVDFLRSQSFAGRKILEFGAGQSTLWWASQARSVVALEADEDWYSSLLPIIPANVQLHLADHQLRHSPLEREALFDLAIIDGLDRIKACALALPHLAHDGAIIIDNADGYFEPDGRYLMMEMIRDRGWCRVDFYGFAPGVSRRHCTSIGFHPSNFMFSGRSNPAPSGD